MSYSLLAACTAPPTSRSLDVSTDTEYHQVPSSQKSGSIYALKELLDDDTGVKYEAFTATATKATEEVAYRRSNFHPVDYCPSHLHLLGLV